MTDTLKLNESTLDYFVRKANENFELAYKEAQELNERMHTADGFAKKLKETFIQNTIYYFSQFQTYVDIVRKADLHRFAVLYGSISQNQIHYIMETTENIYRLAGNH